MRTAVAILQGVSVLGSHCFVDLIHHYPFSVDASDAASGANGTLINGASVGNGSVWLDGADDYVQCNCYFCGTAASCG